MNREIFDRKGSSHTLLNVASRALRGAGILVGHGEVEARPAGDGVHMAGGNARGDDGVSAMVEETAGLC